MGTQTTLELALDHPEKVDKLILYSANCGGDEGLFPERYRDKSTGAY